MDSIDALSRSRCRERRLNKLLRILQSKQFNFSSEELYAEYINRPTKYACATILLLVHKFMFHKHRLPCILEITLN